MEIYGCSAADFPFYHVQAVLSRKARCKYPVTLGQVRIRLVPVLWTIRSPMVSKCLYIFRLFLYYYYVLALYGGVSCIIFSMYKNVSLGK